MPHADVLMAYADAAVRRDADLAERRAAVESALGAEAVVDAAATVANYQRMVRIADGCGIPLDRFTDRAKRRLARLPGGERVLLGAEHLRGRGVAEVALRAARLLRIFLDRRGLRIFGRC